MACSQAAPLGVLGRPLRVIVGLFIGGNHAGPCTTFDRHVADRHPAFHRQISNGLAVVFNDVTRCRRHRPDLTDNGKNDVLRT